MKRIIYLITMLVMVTGFAKAQSQTFTFTINGKDYTVTEQRINDLFGAGFQSIVTRGLAKDKDFDVWRLSFDRWKALALAGRYKWTTYANRVGEENYTGDASKEDMGLTEDGKSAKGNINKKSNKRERMAFLNGLMIEFITNNITEYRLGSQ